MSQVAESVGPEGRYLHLGLTSSDVVDTGLALQLRAAGHRLLADCDRLLGVLIARARAEADTTMMGRTHSVHAEPTTFGLKLAGWAFEIDRGRTRLATAVDEIGTGKISGRSGRTATSTPTSRRRSSPSSGCTSTRSAPRSSSATGTPRCSRRSRSWAGRWSASRPRSATSSTPRSARSRSRSRPARRARRRCPTSATRSPSERIAGLARLLRGYAQTALEDQPLWHERDISHSSAERVILPDATILLDYMLVRMTGLIEGLIVRSERMRENISRGLGLHASSRVLVALVEKAGIGREEAYAIVQRAALRAADERAPLRDLLAVDPVVAQRLSLADLDACFDEATFLRNVHEVIARLDRIAADAHRRRRRPRGRGPDADG